MRLISINIAQQQKDKLQEESRLTGIGYSEIIRRAIDEYFARKDKIYYVKENVESRDNRD